MNRDDLELELPTEMPAEMRPPRVSNHAYRAWSEQILALLDPHVLQPQLFAASRAPSQVAFQLLED